MPPPPSPSSSSPSSSSSSTTTPTYRPSHPCPHSLSPHPPPPLFFSPLSKPISDTSQTPSPHHRPSVDLTLSPLSSDYDPASPRGSSACSNDALPSSSSLYDSLRPDRTRPPTRPSSAVAPLPPPVPTPAPLSKSVSARALGIPTGKVECLPFERPPTPVRLPRPRVFINPSSLRSSASLDFAQHVENPLPSRPVAHRLPQQNTHFFSGEEDHHQHHVDHDDHDDDDHHHHHHSAARYLSHHISDPDDRTILFDTNPGEQRPTANLTRKVHRVLSSLRSISFQNAVIEDLDTAWGQAVADDFRSARRRRNDIHSASSRWRRPRGALSATNGVQQFTANDCYSEADADSILPYAASRHNPRGYGRPDARKGFGARLAAPNTKSICARRDRRPLPRPSQYIVTNGAQAYLAAASSLNDTVHPVTAVVPVDTDSIDRRRGSVDKYVEFIHASAQRESRGKLLAKNFPGRVISRAQAVFRRKWK